MNDKIYILVYTSFYANKEIKIVLGRKIFMNDLKNVLNENSEAQKKRLQRMIIRKQMFSWRTTARETLEVYKQAIQDFKKYE